MLNVAKLAAGQDNYYLDSVASGVEDYYLGAGEEPGVWTGQAAERLHLAGDFLGIRSVHVHEERNG